MQAEKIISNKGLIIDGPFILKPKIFEDNRGYFYETWNKEIFDKLISYKVNFVQDNQSNSREGVLRGLHFQLPPQPQGKLVRATKGEIFDVIVDLRKKSKTFLHWYGINLSETNKIQIWIPEGFAHGFLTISKRSTLEYKVSNHWSKEFERSLTWNDLTIGIKWPIEKLKLDKPYLSEKDSKAFSINELIKKGEIFK